MGGGSTVRQHERRFFQGEPEETGRKEECGEAYWSVKTFGEYEVHKTEVGEYELIKMGIIVGVFSEARVEEERILFPLSHGIAHAANPEGVRSSCSSP